MDVASCTTAQLLEHAGWKLRRACPGAPWAAVWTDPRHGGAWLQYAALTEEMGRRDGYSDPSPASTAPEPATPPPPPDSEDLF